MISVNEFLSLTICLISDADKFNTEVKLLLEQNQTKPTSPPTPQTNQPKTHTKTKPADTLDIMLPNTHTMTSRSQLLHAFQRD